MPAFLTKLFRAAPSSVKRTSSRGRRSFLESLEPRYALTAPVAVDDNFFAQYADVPNTAGPLLVLSNDEDVDTLPSLLKVGEVNGTAVPAVAEDITFPTLHGSVTLVFINGHHEFFTYTPAPGYTGEDSFDYRTSDGTALSNLAEVTITVQPLTGIGDDVPSSINEGDGLHLNDLDDDGNSRTSAPAPTYFWYLDTAPASDPFGGSYDPPASALLNGPSGSSVATLDLDWSDLSSVGIVDGLTSSAVLTLKIVDDNDQVAMSSTLLSVFDVAPEPVNFSLSPASTGVCGDTSVVLSATFREPNPLETDFNVSIDWDLSDSVPPEALTYTDNGDGTYTVSAELHNYEPGANYVPILHIDGTDADEATFGWFLSTPFDVFQFDPLPFAKIREPGDGVNLTSPEVGVAYAWSVTRNGAPYTLPSGTVTDDDEFAFTPTEPGVYVTRLVATVEIFPGLTNDSIYEDTVIVVGGGSGGVSSVEISGVLSSNPEGTLIELGSDVVGGCGTPVYAWSVFKDGSTTSFAEGNAASFSFTPTDDGSYVVNLTVDGVSADPQTIEVSNVAPTAVLAGDTAGVPTQVLSFTADLDDDSSVDQGELVATIDWGDGSTPQALFALNNAVTHHYASVGTFSVTVSVTDDHGIVTTTPHVVTISSSISVSGTTLAVQPAGMTITAPATNNTISVAPGSLIVTIDGVPTKFHTAPASITIHGGDGNDTITVAPGINTQFIVHGGGGNDTIIGGGGNDKLNGDSGDDILLGQDGADVLVGGPGRDIIIGGDGKDALHGKAEDDILVSGIVNFGANLNAALAAIHAEWTSSSNFLVRMANIEGWGLNPTAYQLNSSMVADDNDQDTLTGDQGIDWFFANLWLGGDDDATKKDKVVDINVFELLFANDLDF